MTIVLCQENTGAYRLGLDNDARLYHSCGMTQNRKQAEKLLLPFKKRWVLLRV